MNIKTAIQIFIFLIILISLYLFIKITFLSENQEIMDLDLEEKEVKVEKIDTKESSGDIVENINYKSIDANGNEYNLNASRGEISKENENIIILKNVSGELQLKDKSNIIKFIDMNVEGRADKIKLDLSTGDIIITMLSKQKIQITKE